jgi:small-conductance mechanosensitive channel
VAFFLGFGDSALNFELRFWAAQRETWFQLKSEVTIAVARALQQADIEIPFPQQDLHVRSIAPSVASGSVITRRDFVTETAETAHVLKEESA